LQHLFPLLEKEARAKPRVVLFHSQHLAKTLNSQAVHGIQRAAKAILIMEKLDKDLQNWLWFFTGAAVVISAGLAKIKLSERR